MYINKYINKHAPTSNHICHSESINLSANNLYEYVPTRAQGKKCVSAYDAHTQRKNNDKNQILCLFIIQFKSILILSHSKKQFI